MTNGYDTFSSMNAVKAAFSAAGSFWFTPSAMKFFNSKIETDIIAGKYFITSERMKVSADYPKLFSIRKVVRSEDGTLDIETIGEFQEFKTRALARGALVEYLETHKD